MAVSSNLTSLEDFEGTPIFADYGGGKGAGANTDIFIEATQSGGRRVDNQLDQGFGAQFAATDLSAVAEHVKVWLWVTQWAACTQVQLRISSGADDDHDWPAAEFPPLGGFVPVWVEVQRTPELGGTADLTAIVEVGILIDLGDVGGVSENLILDEILHGTSGLLWSGTGGDFADFRAYEDTNSEGVLISNAGVDFCYARLEIGDATPTAFLDADFLLVYPEQALVGLGFMGLTVDLQNVGTDVDLNRGVVTSGNVATAVRRPDLIVLDDNGAFDTSGMTFGGLRRLLLTSGATFVDTTINNCGQIDMVNSDFSGQMDLTAVSSEYVDSQETFALNTASGDFEIIARVAAVDWTPVTPVTIVSHSLSGAATTEFEFAVAGTRTLRLIVGDGVGITTLTSTDLGASLATDGSTLWVRVVYDQSAGQASFYISRDPADTPTGDLLWTARGIPTGTSRSMGSTTRAFQIGRQGSGTPEYWDGQIMYVEFWNSGFRATGAGHGNLIFRADWRTGVDFTGTPSTRADDFDLTGITWEEQTSPTYTQGGSFTTAAVIDGCAVSNSFSEAAIFWNINNDPGDVGGELDNIDFTSSGTGHAIELGPQCPATVTFNNHSYTGYAGTDGSTGNEVLYNNSGKAITVNLVTTTGLTIRNGNGSSTTAQTTVNLTVVVVDEATVAIPYATVRIEENDGTLVSSGTANNLGIFVGTFNYTADLDVNVGVRKSSPGDTRYLPFTTPATIQDTGLTVTAPMAVDANAGIRPSVGILKHGVISENLGGTATQSITVTLPAGTSRKLLVGFMYWDNPSNLTVSAATYDGNVMTNVAAASVAEQEGAGNFHEIAYYYYDIPDADNGKKVILVTWSGNVALKSLGFAIVDDAATGAVDSSAATQGDQVTGNPSISLNNSAAAWSVGYTITDAITSPTATGVASIYRSDLGATELQMIAILAADRTATGVHTIGADYGGGTKTWVGGGVSVLKN